MQAVTWEVALEPSILCTSPHLAMLNSRFVGTAGLLQHGSAPTSFSNKQLRHGWLARRHVRACIDSLNLRVSMQSFLLVIWSVEFIISW
jgi:hypothetical protein